MPLNYYTFKLKSHELSQLINEHLVLMGHQVLWRKNNTYGLFESSLVRRGRGYRKLVIALPK